jgi:prepilin-type N-terminal cleavage/methylation domain-containing protein
MNQFRRAYSLIELLMVVAIIGVLAGAVIPSISANAGVQLESTAEIVAGDLAYCRSLAVTHNDSYLFTLDAANNRYVITHSGTDPTLDTLPKSAYRDYHDAATEQTTDLDLLPAVAGGVRLVGARTAGTTPATVTTIEFRSLGQTTRSDRSVVWLMTGSGDGRRFISISVDAVTGLAKIGALQGQAPTGLTLPADSATVH